MDLNDGWVGASTGYMEALRGSWEALVAEAAVVSTRAVELSALSAYELPALIDFLRTRGVPDFEYVSLHGPAKDWNAAQLGWIDELADVVGVVGPVGGIIMHPDTFDDPAAFAVLGTALVIENMDPRKRDGRSVDELTRYFEALPTAGFCLDVAHTKLIDPSMALAHQMLDVFGDRLREVHVSSILDDGTHVPLQLDDVELFHDVLVRCRDVPWILEAAPAA